MSLRNASAPAGMKNGSFFPRPQVKVVSTCGSIPGIWDRVLRSRHSPETNRAESLYFQHVQATPYLVCKIQGRSEEHTSELQSLTNLVCRLLLEKKKNKKQHSEH